MIGLFLLKRPRAWFLMASADRVLVLGASGFVGRHVAETLLARGKCAERYSTTKGKEREGVGCSRFIRK